MTEEEKQMFYGSRIRTQDEAWNRMKWIKETERKIDIENVRTWEITKFLYNSGTMSYVNRNYASSILSIASAIDSFLSSIISVTEFAEISLLSKRIKKAEELNKISTDLAEELLVFNDKIRNHLVHPKGPNTHFYLGGEFDNEKCSWTKEFQLNNVMVKIDGMQYLKIDPLVNMKQVCEYSVLLFMRTVRDHLDLKYGRQ